VDDILLASSDVSLLRDTKKFLSSNFDMKDLGEASYVLGIEFSETEKMSLRTIIEGIFRKSSKEI
jgi:hypothetical protein